MRDYEHECTPLTETKLGCNTKHIHATDYYRPVYNSTCLIISVYAGKRLLTGKSKPTKLYDHKPFSVILHAGSIPPSSNFQLDKR